MLRYPAGVRGRHFPGGPALVGGHPVDGPSRSPSASLRRRVAGAVRTLGARLNRPAPGIPEALEELSKRADAVDAGLREADQHYVNLAVHSTERANALTDRVAEAEARLAELEIDTARIREGMRRFSEPDASAEGVVGQVLYWRRRLAAGEPSAETRHGPVARVVTDVGALLLPAQDEVMLSYLRQHGVWEKEESDQLRGLLRPGMTFVDVGAHVGYMTLLASAAVGPTGRGFAFEPEPANFRLLAANLATHGVTNVQAVPAAAWDTSGSLSLSLCADNTGDHRAYVLPGRESVEVLALALDDVLPGDLRIDVVKVDAQATDDVAIRGMERTLARNRPVLLVEFWPEGIVQRGAKPREVLEYYRELGYDLSVLGAQQRETVASTPLDAVLDAAVTSPTEFCTLLLTPGD